MFQTVLLALAVIFIGPPVIAIMIYIGWFTLILISTLVGRLLSCIK